MRNLEGRHRRGAEQHRRVDDLVFQQAYFRQVLRQRLETARNAQVDEGQIVGIDEGLVERHPAVQLSIVIGRFPDSAVRLANANRFVVDLAGERQIPLQQAVEQDRFDQRADRALRHQRAIESRVIGFAIADQCLDIAAQVIRDHHRRLQPGFVESLQTLLQAGLEITLYLRIEGSDHAQPTPRQVGAGIAGAQLTLDQVEVCRERIHSRQPPDDTQRRGSRGGIFTGIDQPLVEHDLEYQVASRGRGLWRPERIIARRPVDHADQQREVLRFEVIDAAPEQHAAGTRKTVNGDTVLLQQEHLVDIGSDDRLLAEA